MGADDNSYPTIPIFVISWEKEKIKIKETIAMQIQLVSQITHSRSTFTITLSFVMKSQLYLGLPFRF